MNYREMFADVYRFYERYRQPNNTTEFWQKFSVDIGRISLKHKEHEFCNDLLMAVADEINRVCNNAK